VCRATRRQRMGKQLHLCSQRSARPCRSRQAAWSRGARVSARDIIQGSGPPSVFRTRLGVIRGIPFTSISTAFSRLPGPSGALCGACASSGENPAHRACLPGPRNNCKGGRAGAPRQHCSAPHALLKLQRRQQHSETVQGLSSSGSRAVCIRKTVRKPLLACLPHTWAGACRLLGMAGRLAGGQPRARTLAPGPASLARDLRTPGQPPDARGAPRRLAAGAAALSRCACGLATCPRSCRPAHGPVNAPPYAHASAYRWRSLLSPSCNAPAWGGPANVHGAQAA